MSVTSKYLAGRLREVYLDGKWIANTNYKELLNGLSREEAIKTVGNLNSIAALVFHVNYYLEGLLQVLEGRQLEIRDQYSYDLPTLSSDQQWTELRDRLLNNAKTFASRVETLPESKWETPFVNEKYGSYLRNIEGVIEHSYYHLGQISLIRKMITTAN